MVQREASPWQHGQGLQPCNHAMHWGSAQPPCKQHVENVVKCLHQTNLLQVNVVIPAESQVEGWQRYCLLPGRRWMTEATSFNTFV